MLLAIIAGCASYVEGSGLTTLDHEVPYVRFIFGFMGDYGPQFPLRLVNKDFRLILDSARSEDAHVPAAEAAFQVNNSFLSRRFNGSRGKSPMITIANQPILIEDLGKYSRRHRRTAHAFGGRRARSSRLSPALL